MNEIPDVSQLSLENQFTYQSMMNGVDKASREQVIELYAALLAHYLFHKQTVKKLLHERPSYD